MGASAPRCLKRRPTRHEGEDTGRWPLINQEPKPLQGGRIDPVQILDNEEHRLLLGTRQCERQEHVQRALALLLRAHLQRRVAIGWRGQREKRRQERQVLLQV